MKVFIFLFFLLKFFILYIEKIIRVLGPYRALFLYDKVYLLISPKGFEKISQKKLPKEKEKKLGAARQTAD